MRLEGKKAIVTGASQSIGQAIAIALAKEGADVAFSFRSNEEGANRTLEAIKKTGRKGLALHADFLEDGQCESFIQSSLDFLGQVDILVNNAGSALRSSIFDISSDDFIRIININAAIPLRLSQLAVKHMVEKKIPGSIINISSIAGLRGIKERLGYCSSKACLNMVTESSALDLAGKKIRVNAIAPGYIAAGMNEERATQRSKEWDEIVKTIPLGRGGTPEDIASTAVFLASDESSWITGTVIALDGGSTVSL